MRESSHRGPWDRASESVNSPVLFSANGWPFRDSLVFRPSSAKHTPSVLHNLGFSFMHADLCFSTAASATHEQHMFSHLGISNAGLWEPSLGLAGGHPIVGARLTST